MVSNKDGKVEYINVCFNEDDFALRARIIDYTKKNHRSLSAGVRAMLTEYLNKKEVPAHRADGED